MINTNSTGLNKIKEDMGIIMENDIKGMIDLVLAAEKERIEVNKFRYIAKINPVFPKTHFYLTGV